MIADFKKLKKGYQSGFASLTSALIISLILITINIALSGVNFSSRNNILNIEFKETSFFVAEACVDTAASTIVSQFGFYATSLDVGVNVGANIYSCHYDILELNIPPSGPTDATVPHTYKIQVKAIVQRSVTNLEVRKTFTPFPNTWTTNYWIEIPVL